MQQTSSDEASQACRIPGACLNFSRKVLSKSTLQKWTWQFYLKKRAQPPIWKKQISIKFQPKKKTTTTTDTDETILGNTCRMESISDLQIYPPFSEVREGSRSCPWKVFQVSQGPSYSKMQQRAGEKIYKQKYIETYASGSWETRSQKLKTLNKKLTKKIILLRKPEKPEILSDDSWEKLLMLRRQAFFHSPWPRLNFFGGWFSWFPSGIIFVGGGEMVSSLHQLANH